MFERKEEIEIKKIFAHLNGWTFKSMNNQGMVYWEVNFKEGIDSSIDKEMLRKRVYDLPFEPAVSIGRGVVADFYGVYNVESLRKELEIADFEKVA